MKINLTQEIKEDTFLQHIVISCLTDTVTKELMKVDRIEGDRICDLKLTIDGHELDLRSFVERWQSQVSYLAKNKAEEILEEKFGDVEDLFYDLEERLKSEIKKRLEDWEKE